MYFYALIISNMKYVQQWNIAYRFHMSSMRKWTHHVIINYHSWGKLPFHLKLHYGVLLHSNAKIELNCRMVEIEWQNVAKSKSQHIIYSLTDPGRSEHKKKKIEALHESTCYYYMCNKIWAVSCYHQNSLLHSDYRTVVLLFWQWEIYF